MPSIDLPNPSQATTAAMPRSPPMRFSPEIAPSKIYKHYFDDPTLSDLTLRLSDRSVHVHRIVLCRNSEYFDKLITTGFKESGQNEIELHDDDPMAMIVLLRYIYVLPYDDLIRDEETSLEFLAKVYVAADEYQIGRLRTEAHYEIKNHKHYEHMLGVDDFLSALKTIVTGTTPRDGRARPTMIKVCVEWIASLRHKDSFSDLLRECGDVGAEIIAHENLAHMLEGMWYCDQAPHPEAVQGCLFCHHPYSKSYVRSHRHLVRWLCETCGASCHPICLACGDDGLEYYPTVSWRWKKDEDS